MARRTLTTVVLATALLLGAVACGGGDPPVPSTTTGTALPTRTTLPPVPTTVSPDAPTTTVAAEVATTVDTCALLAPGEPDVVVGDDPGPGTPVESSTQRAPDEPAMGDRSTEDPAQPPTVTTVPESDRPTVLMSSCTWPTEGPVEMTLSYLAPSTAGSALQHLQRIIDLGTRFSAGARVLPLSASDDLAPAALIDPDGAVLEIAVVTGSALLYIVPASPPEGSTREANALLAVLMAAGRRAPG